MKQLSLLLLLCAAQMSFGQSMNFGWRDNGFTEVEGTSYVVKILQKTGKIMRVSNDLQIIDTKDGSRTIVDFPEDASIHSVTQVKLDDKNLNKLIVTAKTVNLDQDKRIDYDDPLQVLVMTVDGKEKVRITEDRFYVQSWVVNKVTGCIVIAGHYDEDENGKINKEDVAETLVYDLVNMRMIKKLR